MKSENIAHIQFLSLEENNTNRHTKVRKLSSKVRRRPSVIQSRIESSMYFLLLTEVVGFRLESASSLERQDIAVLQNGKKIGCIKKWELLIFETEDLTSHLLKACFHHLKFRRTLRKIRPCDATSCINHTASVATNLQTMLFLLGRNRTPSRRLESRESGKKHSRSVASAPRARINNKHIVPIRKQGVRTKIHPTFLQRLHRMI